MQAEKLHLFAESMKEIASERKAFERVSWLGQKMVKLWRYRKTPIRHALAIYFKQHGCCGARDALSLGLDLVIKDSQLVGWAEAGYALRRLIPRGNSCQLPLSWYAPT